MTVVSYGRQVATVLRRQILSLLRESGAEVIDLRTVSPLDMPTILASARKTGRVVIVHEAVRNCGIGAEISARINEALFGKLRAPIQRVCGFDSPIPYSKPLETAFLPNKDKITAAVRATMDRPP